MERTQNVLLMYRRLLRYASRMHGEKREESLHRIKTEFRMGKSVEADSAKELLSKANSTLSYLKMVTPKQQGDTKSSAMKIVFGEKKAAERKAVTNWTGSNMDPDSVKRHYRGLARAGFRNNDHAKGFF